MHDVLVGYDGSTSAHHAVDFALDLAERQGARLHIVAVAATPDWGVIDVEKRDLIEAQEKHSKMLLDELKDKLRPTSASVHLEMITGHPAKELVLYAERHNIDHLVVGHRGKTAFERWLLGSIARQVIAYAPCSVTIVRGRSEPG
ncbi:universal stress protein [Paraburkholderia sp.]|uniref:universal stress protein n=1 Tax=Paraburkholderia sp. TaxID=1926495 RepID=UPI0039E25EC6